MRCDVDAPASVHPYATMFNHIDLLINGKHEIVAFLKTAVVTAATELEMSLTVEFDSSRSTLL